MTAPVLPETVTLADVRAAAREIGRRCWAPPAYDPDPPEGHTIGGYTRSLAQMRRQVTLSPLAALIVDQILEVL